VFVTSPSSFPEGAQTTNHNFLCLRQKRLVGWCLLDLCIRAPGRIGEKSRFLSLVTRPLSPHPTSGYQEQTRLNKQHCTALVRVSISPFPLLLSPPNNTPSRSYGFSHASSVPGDGSPCGAAQAAPANCTQAISRWCFQDPPRCLQCPRRGPP
jgi:hypothetical protein